MGRNLLGDESLVLLGVWVEIFGGESPALLSGFAPLVVLWPIFVCRNLTNCAYHLISRGGYSNDYGWLRVGGFGCWLSYQNFNFHPPYYLSFQTTYRFRELVVVTGSGDYRCTMHCTTGNPVPVPTIFSNPVPAKYWI